MGAEYSEQAHLVGGGGGGSSEPGPSGGEGKHPDSGGSVH